MMKRTITGLILFAGTILFSCKKDISSSTGTSIQTLVATDSTLSIFNAAITRTNETALLQQSAAFTVIVPVNAAFIASGIDMNAINTMNIPTLDSMLKYLFINGTIQSLSANDSVFTTQLALPIYGSTDGTYSYFNGARSGRNTNISGNGVMYESNAVPLPPSMTLNQYLQSDPNLTLFKEAMTRTGIISSLNTGWYTVFAPDNTAFSAAGYPDIASIDNADLNTLTNLINYHVLNAAYFTNKLIGTLSTDYGGVIVASNTGGTLQIAGHGNNNLISLTIPNLLMTGNIIVHRVNGVLLP